MNLRKFLVREFALNGAIRIGNRILSVSKAARYSIPITVIFFILAAATTENDFSSLFVSTLIGILTAIFGILFVITMLIIFVYFRIKPLTKDDEKYMDAHQLECWDYLNSFFQ